MNNTKLYSIKLKPLMQKLKSTNLVEPQDKLELYATENENEYLLIEHMDSFTIEGREFSEFNGKLLSFIIKDNMITFIGLEAYKAITISNRALINYLTSLIYMKIEDFEEYSKDEKGLIISI